jgi:hypothetical protein
LRGWGVWEDQAGTRRKYETGRFGWCSNTRTSTRRNGPGYSR